MDLNFGLAFGQMTERLKHIERQNQELLREIRGMRADLRAIWTWGLRLVAFATTWWAAIVTNILAADLGESVSIVLKVLKEFK